MHEKQGLYHKFKKIETKNKQKQNQILKSLNLDKKIKRGFLLIKKLRVVQLLISLL